MQPPQQYGTQYGAQPAGYPAQPGLYAAASQPVVYTDLYQAAPSPQPVDMALAGAHPYPAYPVPLDQYVSADSSYGSYSPAPA